MDKVDQIYWLLDEFNPGGHNEDFMVEATMIVELGFNTEQALTVIADRTAYVVGSNEEFETSLYNILG